MRSRAVLATAVLTIAALSAGCSSSKQAGGASSPATPASSSAASSPSGSSAAASMPAKQLPWNRPDDQQAQVQAAGLSLTSQETLTVHYHAHLDVFVNGKKVPVPGGLGINVGPNGQAPAHGSPGIAPLHTHDATGVVHIEAPKADKFTLGQVFDEWGVRLTANQAGAYSPVKVYVDGKPVTGDPAGIVLKPHEEVAVVAGHGTVSVPPSYPFPGGE